MRFRPEQHLRRQRDIRAVREQGRRINCGAFTLWGFRRPAATESGSPAETPARTDAEVRRLGVVASIAAVGHAVRRNRAKRRLREVFRRRQEDVPAGCDVLLSARAAAVDAPMTELEQRFQDACRRVFPSNHV